MSFPLQVSSSSLGDRGFSLTKFKSLRYGFGAGMIVVASFQVTNFRKLLIGSHSTVSDFYFSWNSRRNDQWTTYSHHASLLPSSGRRHPLGVAYIRFMCFQPAIF
ncbi:hypothetical protein HanIR_Chr06g0263681 [Helianthus annuus]|nr:hypothetical protein HanIR_Chr06g0263681 [Helianthus annuus]